MPIPVGPSDQLGPDPLADAVIERIQSLRSETQTLRDLLAQDDVPDTAIDGRNIVGIFGERGSGKSTLLWRVCRELRRENVDVVLPVMRPEHFAQDDSVLSSFLASLWDQLEDERTSPGDDERTAEVRELIAEAQRYQVISRAPRGVLEHATSSTYDFAADAITVSRSNVRLLRHLRLVATALTGLEHPRQVIIPVDDADLAEHSLPHILRDLGILALVPGFVPLVCLCPADLQDAWVRDLGAIGVDAARANTRFRSQKAKLFPVASRFEMPALAVSQRLHFTPFAQSMSLREQLERAEVILGDSSEIHWPLSVSFAIAGRVPGVANPLPSEPRSLVELWETLAALTPGDQLVSERGARFLNALIELVGRGAADAIVDVPSVEYVDRLYVNQFATECSLGVSSRRNTWVRSGRGFEHRSAGRIEIRALTRVTGRIGPPDDNNERASMRPDQIGSLFALQEIVFGSELIEIGPEVNRVGLNEWAWLQRIRFGAVTTDDQFLILPDVVTLGDVDLAYRAWEDLRQRCEQGADVVALFEAAIWWACQWSGVGCPARGVEGTLEGYESMFAAAAQLYELATPGMPFSRWFAESLPYQLHDGLLPREIVHRNALLHRAAVTQSEGDDSLWSMALMRLDRRLVPIAGAARGGGDHWWIAGYSHIAELAGLTSARALTDLRPEWDHFLATASIGRNVGGAAVDDEAPTADQGLSPYPTPQGTALYRRAKKLLEEWESGIRTYRPPGVDR